MPTILSRFFAVAARFQARASLTLSGVTVVDRGRIVNGAVVDMSGTDIEIVVDLGLDAGEAVARECDLTCGYVRINADYTS